MAKFTEDQIRQIIYERNSDENKKNFEMYKNKTLEISKLWKSIADKLNFECTTADIIRKYNDAIKTFRRNYTEYKKSDLKRKITWPFFQDFIKLGVPVVSSIKNRSIDKANNLSQSYIETNDNTKIIDESINEDLENVTLSGSNEKNLSSSSTLEVSEDTNQDVSDNKKYHDSVSSIKNILSFMKDESDKKYDLIKKLINNKDNANFDKRITKLEENNVKIINMLEKLAKKY